MADLVTAAEVKARAKITDATDDALITALIGQVSDQIQEFTRRTLTPEAAQTYLFDTSSGSEIYVRRGIRAVTSMGVATSNQPDTGGTYTAVAAADILLRPLPHERRPGWPAERIVIAGSIARLGWWLNGATVSGDFGFAATPPAIKGIAIDAVLLAYRDKQGGQSGTIGADDIVVQPLENVFRRNSPQMQTLLRYRAGQGIA